MAEPKKVAFSTLRPIKKEKKRERKAKSLRIMLTLAESNEKSFPEFNYRELVSQKLHERLGKKRLGDVINGPALDPTDPFAADEDAALKALAKQFENRYGGYTPSRKKKRRKENDFSTLGEGYDETDPFIDNSDACDEVVPTHMETKHRGFYINSGELDFEMVAEESEDEDSCVSEAEVRRKKKQNLIQSDEEVHNEEREDEEDGDEEDEDGLSKKRRLYENGIIQPKKRKLDEGELLRKRKKMIGQFNAKNQEKKDSDQEVEKVANGSDSKGETQPSEQSIKASIEAVVNRAREEAGEKKDDSDESASSSSNSTSSDSDSSGSSSSSESDSEEEDEEEEAGAAENEEINGEGEEREIQDATNNNHHFSENENDLPLPDNLPPDLIQVINRLKEEGHSSKGSSQKFFTDSVNRLLLSIEIKLNKLGGRKKTQLYNHLSQHLPCGTQTIVKRAKNLLAEKQENKLREPLRRLKEAVDSHMPSMMEQHALECQKVAESKGENGVTQNEDDEIEDVEKKKSRLPKKKFIFTDEIRKLLCDVVHVRVQFWQMIKKRSETPEEYIRAFLDSEVRSIWPKGWMNTRILYKESYESHAIITSSSTSDDWSSMMARENDPEILESVQEHQQQLQQDTDQPAVLSKRNLEELDEYSPLKMPKHTSMPDDPKKKRDKNHVKTAPVKKQICLGGGTVSSVSSSISTQPPKPSLSATVVPRISPSAVSSTSKEIAKKKSPSTEQKDIGAFKVSVEKAASSSGGLSIKSVEKINEGAAKTVTESENVFEKPAEGNSDTKNSSPGKTHFKKAVSSVSVIDLSSDEDKSLTSRVSSSELNRTSGLSELKDNCPIEKDSTSEVSSTSITQKVNSTTSEGKKDDNLDEEMNLVMNELLQISKQKSADDNIEKSMKDSLDHSSVTSTTSKQQNVSHSQSHHHHLEKEHHPQSSVPQVKQQSTLLQHKQHTSQSHSPVDHPKHVSPVQQQKHLNEKHLSEQQQKQSTEHSPVQKVHSPKHHSPVQQQRQTIQHKSPVQQTKQTVLPNSPVQSQSQSHSLQHTNSPHQPKQSQPPQSLNLQHSKPQQSLNPQPPLNLQESKSQQPLNLRHTNPQYNSAPKKKTPEPAHQKKPSQHYSHSQHQQQAQPKPVNIPVSKWNKGEMSLSSSSPTSTNKNNSSWGSSHEVSPSRQRQTEAPIVSSTDPLANLRMMHGLSVSSITKKTSASSVYHSPAALATSSLGTYSSSGTKKSSGNSNSTAVSNTNKIPAHSGSVGMVATPNKTSSLSYSSSQSKHSTPSHTYSSSSSSKHTASQGKARLDPYAASMGQSLYSTLAQDQQLNAFKQLQQQQQSNHRTSHQQQDLWQQMNAGGFLPGMSGISNNEMLKLMSQMGKSMDSFTSSSQPGSGQHHGQF
ncbi:uncharacterized protein yem isoform X2 [Panulirus ornatus]|uniref:uncharacterized protein yem isoform X2 n=1 Tax=Panulirus ornatus TaxID=150431 RepID=UPI003A8A756E